MVFHTTRRRWECRWERAAGYGLPHFGRPLRPSAVPRVRRLPVVPRPVEGESFASSVDRVAAKLDVPAGQATRALGLECREWASSTRPGFFGVTLTPTGLSALRDATGPPAHELRRRGGRWRDHREVIDAIAWTFQTGSQWMHLPGKYGNWRGATTG